MSFAGGNISAQLQEVTAYCTKLNDHVCACQLTVNLLGALRHRRVLTRDITRHGCRAQDGRTQSVLGYNASFRQKTDGVMAV
jgi:hypothetical protein